MVCDEIPGAVIMDVQQPEDVIPPACNMSCEEGAEPGEFPSVELPGADLDGEDRDHLDQS